jgi:hypothetical protein
MTRAVVWASSDHRQVEADAHCHQASCGADVLRLSNFGRDRRAASGATQSAAFAVIASTQNFRLHLSVRRRLYASRKPTRHLLCGPPNSLSAERGKWIPQPRTLAWRTTDNDRRAVACRRESRWEDFQCNNNLALLWRTSREFVLPGQQLSSRPARTPRCPLNQQRHAYRGRPE